MTESESSTATPLTLLCIACQQAYVAGNGMRGDECFESICRLFEPAATVICSKILRSGGILSAMEDAVQESLFAIWNEIRANKFDETAQFEPWANTITRRTTISVGRRQKYQTFITGLMQDDTLEEPADDPSAVLESQEFLQQLRDILSEEDLRLLMKRYCDLASHSSLAAEYNTTPGAIRARLFRIKERVRAAFCLPADCQTNERARQ